MLLILPAIILYFLNSFISFLSNNIPVLLSSKLQLLFSHFHSQPKVYFLIHWEKSKPPKRASQTLSWSFESETGGGLSNLHYNFQVILQHSEVWEPLLFTIRKLPSTSICLLLFLPLLQSVLKLFLKLVSLFFKQLACYYSLRKYILFSFQSRLSTLDTEAQAWTWTRACPEADDAAGRSQIRLRRVRLQNPSEALSH